MQAGEYDRSVTIQAKAVTLDDFGGTVETWADEITRRAKKIDQGGRDFRAAGVLNAEVTTIFRMRYYAGLTPQKRIVCGGLTYDIVAVFEGAGRLAETVVQAKAQITL
jgi:SPP1 family predicted phage head-tail adaptor